MLQKPYIPYDSERIKKILKCVGKTIADIISIIGKKVSSIDSIDEKSSVSDVDNLIEIFETYKEETRKKQVRLKSQFMQRYLPLQKNLRFFLTIGKH